MINIELLAKNLRTYPRYIYMNFVRTTRDAYKHVKKLKYLSYDREKGSWLIKDKNISWDKKMAIRSELMGTLRFLPPKASIKIDDVVTGYYDFCLERYLYQRNNQNFISKDTCWFKKAQNNKCIGWVDPVLAFGVDEKRHFLDKLAKKKKRFTDKGLVDKLSRDEEGYIILRSEKSYNQDDKSLELCKKFSGIGFSNIISSLSPIILGYSSATKRYRVISGRHRIAALRYLRSQRKIQNIRIQCHIVQYPFALLEYTRPFSDSCRKCDWGGCFDPGSGTHQDFYVREGVAVMRGHNSKKGGRQKWNRMKPIFREMVQGKTVLDIGSYRGLYCLKALEYGAKSATACEISDDLVQVTETIKTKYSFDELQIIQGDFYDKDCYQRLQERQYDTIFLFGIIHHLLRLGIENKILYSFDELIKRIARVAIHGVIIEFAMPKEESLASQELKEYVEKFSEKEFITALNKYFPTNSNLGKCKYVSGNKYGRYMYYGTKR